MTIIDIFFAIEVLILSWFLTSIPRFCSGNAVGILITALMLTVTSYYKQIADITVILWQNILGKAIIIIIAALFFMTIVYLSVLSINMIKAQKNYPQKSCTVIILGCRVINKRPSRMLRRRLDAAIEYLNKFPNERCILSGGRGSDELISEAEAMYNYLTERGINKNRLIMEASSATTTENLAFSSDLIEALDLNKEIAIATDGFHQYRVKLIADMLNIKPYSICAQTEPRYIFIYWVREWIAVTIFFLKKIKG